MSGEEICSKCGNYYFHCNCDEINKNKVYQIQDNQIYYVNQLSILIEKQKNLNDLFPSDNIVKDQKSKWLRVEFNQNVRNLMNSIKDNDFSHD